ncbi:MAG: N-acetyltransferase [Acidobacteria bacterium]|nr:N-acetyltransferase [Acidobacteriota bacterium]
MSKTRIHPTAIVETDVQIGEGTAIWDNVHIRAGAKVGRNCIIGEKTYIAGQTRIGDRCKLNAYVYIPAGVTLEDGVMVAAHTVFTNDQYPRACTPDLSSLLPSAPDESTPTTVVRRGATIGANCTVGNNLEIGQFAMVGMGSVVTRSVKDFHLAAGSPARPVGIVCRCGQPLVRFADSPALKRHRLQCQHCGYRYSIDGDTVEELELQPAAAA